MRSRTDLIAVNAVMMERASLNMRAPLPSSATSVFDVVDLAPAVIHEVVVALHDLLHLLHVLTGWRLRHHLHELVHALDLEFRHERPVAFRAEVSHQLHFALPLLLHQLRHCLHLFDERADFARLAVHDFTNEQHVRSSCRWVSLRPRVNTQPDYTCLQRCGCMRRYSSASDVMVRTPSSSALSSTKKSGV